MKKLMIFGGAGLALVLVTVAVVFFVVMPKLSGPKAVAATPVSHFELGPTYTLQTRVVNLADPGAGRYLKVQIVLAFAAKQDKQADVTKKLAARETVMQDLLTTLLSSKSSEDLSSPTGKSDLKKAMMQQFASVLSDLHLVDIYFPEFVMQ